MLQSGTNNGFGSHYHQVPLIENNQCVDENPLLVSLVHSG